MHEYKPVTPIWLANTLFFAITKAEHLEIIFNHPESQGKHELYKFLKPLMGYGLFTAPGMNICICLLVYRIEE